MWKFDKQTPFMEKNYLEKSF